MHSCTNLLSYAHCILKLAYYYYYIGSGNSEDQEVATDNCDVKDDKNTLRRSVEDLFNHRYG